MFFEGNRQDEERVFDQCFETEKQEAMCYDCFGRRFLFLVALRLVTVKVLVAVTAT